MAYRDDLEAAVARAESAERAVHAANECTTVMAERIDLLNKKLSQLKGKVLAAHAIRLFGIMGLVSIVVSLAVTLIPPPSTWGSDEPTPPPRVTRVHLGERFGGMAASRNYYEVWLEEPMNLVIEAQSPNPNFTGFAWLRGTQTPLFTWRANRVQELPTFPRGAVRFSFYGTEDGTNCTGVGTFTAVVSETAPRKEGPDPSQAEQQGELPPKPRPTVG